MSRHSSRHFSRPHGTRQVRRCRAAKLAEGLAAGMDAATVEKCRAAALRAVVVTSPKCKPHRPRNLRRGRIDGVHEHTQGPRVLGGNEIAEVARVPRARDHRSVEMPRILEARRRPRAGTAVRNAVVERSMADRLDVIQEVAESAPTGSDVHDGQTNEIVLLASGTRARCDPLLARRTRSSARGVTDTTFITQFSRTLAS